MEVRLTESLKSSIFQRNTYSIGIYQDHRLLQTLQISGKVDLLSKLWQNWKVIFVFFFRNSLKILIVLYKYVHEKLLKELKSSSLICILFEELARSNIK